MPSNPSIAIVDYGMGNTFSIQNACQHVGLKAEISHSTETILNADAVILPGVGAFAEAMARLKELDLINTVKEVAVSNKPIIGVCLGMQLLLSSSDEFGQCEGLDIIPGCVRHLKQTIDPEGTPIKVPHVGWSPIMPPTSDAEWIKENWEKTLLSDIKSGSEMYFVHSYFAQPKMKEVILATSTFGNTTFCSALQFKNITAFQFHPERSGIVGLTVYQNLANMLNEQS